jgi:hypothetical protein
MQTRMTTSKLNVLVALAAIWAWSAVSAQSQTSAQPQAEAQARTTRVTASVAAEQLRFAALGEVVQLRLEVFGASGEKIFDSDFKSGNLLDWPVHDQQGQRLADGAYLCVVTVKDLSGALSRQHGTVLLQVGTATLKVEAPSPLQPARAPEASQPFTILDGEATLPLTVLAHDENQGRVSGGRGALSFRTGDFFAGQDKEHMRLTAAGNLGLGVAEPQAKLDVAGLIRTNEGIVFPDGSVQTTAFVASGRSISGRAQLQRDAQGRTVTERDEKLETDLRLAPNISGSGTTNRVTKWADGPNGVVGDSVISEVGGNVGIGTTAPQSGLDYRSSLAPYFTRDIGPGSTTIPQSALQLGVTNLASRGVGVGPSMLFFADNSAGAKSFLGRVSAVWENPTAGAEAGSLRFQVRANSGDTTASTERMRIDASGFVRIYHQLRVGFDGSTSYNAKLHADGTTSTPYGLVARGLSYGVLAYGGESLGNYGVKAYGYSGVIGVSDLSNSGTAAGVRGEGYNGVYGFSDKTNGNGVVGEADSGASAYGVWGKSTSGYGGYFDGKVFVNGVLSKAGGSFKIDHPLDPENKYLSHSFVESPEMLNIYNGNITLDTDGQAVVQLPEWFGALNRDFRYQLTAIGGPGPNLYIAEEVENNQFKIAGGSAGMKVSWQVTGVRQDAWANDNRIQVEEEKPALERGHYLHPKVYGQPEEKGVDWARRPELMRRLKEERERAEKQSPPKQ